MPEPIGVAGGRVDLSRRIQQSSAIVGSPALAAETIVCQLTIADSLIINAGVLLEGFVAFTVGTSGTAATVRVRQTNVSGSIVGSTGALTVVAANLVAPSINVFDTAAVLPNQTYVLTLQITAGAATSTVSATQLVAIVL